MYDIIIGRGAAEREKYGTRGTILLGRQFVKMGQVTSLANNMYLDIARSHVVFICGKRGGGKSYTMGVIAEGLADIEPDIAKNISIIMMDTMGVYWTMKYPNKKDELLLEEWKLQSKGLDINIFTPKKHYNRYKEQGIPTDYPFAIKPSELDAYDWCMTFDISINDPMGVLIERVTHHLSEAKENYSITDIIEAIRRDNTTEKSVKDATENRFMACEAWGVFDVEATPMRTLVKGGEVSIIDLSCYATSPNAWKINALVIGLISKKLFIQRSLARKQEEYEAIHHVTHFFDESSESGGKEKMPLVWLVVDEAHEYLPREGKTAATEPLIQILREGRQPGISIILASQQPGKIHTDVMTQADTVISHRITARIDTEALSTLMQSYMREGLDIQLDNLPRVSGAGLVFDDTNERLYPMRVRPRFTWHGGSSPSAIPETDESKF